MFHCPDRILLPVISVLCLTLGSCGTGETDRAEILHASPAGWLSEAASGIVPDTGTDTISVSEYQFFNFDLPSGNADAVSAYLGAMWSADTDGTAICSGYFGPCVAEVRMPDGAVCRIDESTDYPFEDVVRYCFSFDDRRRHDAVFSFRVPEWADGVNVRLNDRIVAYRTDDPGFATVRQRLHTGDVISVTFDTEIVFNDTDSGVYVTRGPLAYALQGVGPDDCLIPEHPEAEIVSRYVDGFPASISASPHVVRIQVVRKEDRHGEGFLSAPVSQYLDLVPVLCTGKGISLFQPAS